MFSSQGLIRLGVNFINMLPAALRSFSRFMPILLAHSTERTVLKMGGFSSCAYYVVKLGIIM